MQAVSITGEDGFVSLDATPQARVLFGSNPSSGIIGRLLVLARRLSDGAQKGWDITAMMRKQGSNPVENLAAINTTAFGAAADLTALSAVSIAFFQNGDDVGLTCTGLAGTQIAWALHFGGRLILDNV